jgi:hypothetical protein
MLCLFRPFDILYNVILKTRDSKQENSIIKKKKK